MSAMKNVVITEPATKAGTVFATSMPAAIAKITELSSSAIMAFFGFGFFAASIAFVGFLRMSRHIRQDLDFPGFKDNSRFKKPFAIKLRMSDVLKIDVCGPCGNESLYKELCESAAGRPINITRTDYCIGGCRLGSRVNVTCHDGQLRRYATEELKRGDNVLIYPIGENSVRVVIEDNLPKSGI